MGQELLESFVLETLNLTLKKLLMILHVVQLSLPDILDNNQVDQLIELNTLSYPIC